MSKTCICILVISLVYSICFEININTSEVITFLSIVIGFQMTAFALLFSSDTVKRLYNTKDENNPRLTLCHTLKNNYKLAFNTLLISIVFLLITSDEYRLVHIAVLPIIFVNAYLLYNNANILYKIFIKDAADAKK